MGKGEITNRLALGFRERTGATILRIVRRRPESPRAPHVAIVPVQVDAERSVAIVSPVLSPGRVVLASVLQAVRIHDGNEPQVRSGQDRIDTRIVSGIQEDVTP